MAKILKLFATIPAGYGCELTEDSEDSTVQLRKTDDMNESDADDTVVTNWTTSACVAVETVEVHQSPAFNPDVHFYGDPCGRHPGNKLRYEIGRDCVLCRKESGKRSVARRSCRANVLNVEKSHNQYRKLSKLGKRIQKERAGGQVLRDFVNAITDKEERNLGRGGTHLVLENVTRRPGIMACLALVPWLDIEERDETVIFHVDEELRSICNGSQGRPELGGQSISHFIRNLNKQITKRRKDIGDHRKYGAAYKLNGVSQVQQSQLLDWIQEELGKIPR